MTIVNAEDLKDTDFACVLTHRLEIIKMNIAYDNVKKALNISLPDQQHTYFHQVRQISFGNSKSDLNLCDSENTYHYSIKDGKLPDLTSSNATFLLTHNAKVLPDLNVTLKVLSSNILNVKWTFATVPEGWRTPFEIPEEIIHVKNETRSME